MINYKEVSAGDKRIFFLGSKHSNDKIELNAIKESIKKFDPEVVLIEGDYSKANFKSEEEAVERGLEMGFVSFVCEENNIPFISNDPSNGDSERFVEKKYGIEVKEFYFLLRDATIQKLEEEEIVRIKKLMKSILDEEFNPLKKYDLYFAPASFIKSNNKGKVSLFNKISEELGIFRDDFMFEKISELLKNHSRIFIIKGDYHLKTCFSKIEDIVNRN